MKYTVELRPVAERERRKLKNLALRQRVNDALLALEDEPRPHGVVKLSGTVNEWRIRIGDYRIIYEIDDEEQRVTILRIAHRRQVYR